MIAFYLSILFILNMTNSNQLKSLIEAERSFAALSAEKGIRNAFVTYLDDDAILFMPEPVKGKQRYKERDTIPGTLLWEPQFVDISYSGNLGYSTGPWKLERDTVTAFGHFISIWENKNGKWNVILDTGIDYPEPFPKIEKVNTSSTLNTRIDYEPLIEEKKLLLLDQEINSTDSYRNKLSDHIIILRMNHYPITGIKDASNYLSASNKRFTVIQNSLRIADSGDLAYSYGSFLYDDKKNESYLRIWTRTEGDVWKLALELAKPAE